jgi:hypothetical protein
MTSETAVAGALLQYVSFRLNLIEVSCHKLVKCRFQFLYDSTSLAVHVAVTTSPRFAGSHSSMLFPVIIKCHASSGGRLGNP